MATTTSGASLDNGGSQDQPYVASSQYHSQPSHLRVICAGAGAAGILVAYRMQKALQNYDLVCYEKNSHLGGTWYENKYPGCACDLPAHNYTYPFEPNPDWSRFYVYSDEILQYFEKFVEKYNLSRFIKLRSKIISAVWSEERGVYDVEVETPEGRIKDWAHIFINGCGFLNNWKWPDIPGLHDFKGSLLHTANWDPAINYDGKTVAVIGNGSSGIQVIPEVQKTAKSLTCFMRSPTWIFPSVGADLLQEENQAAKQESSRENAQHIYTEQQKAMFRDNPEALLQYRQRIESGMNDNMNMFLKSHPLVTEAEEFLTKEMHRRIGSGHEDLKKALVPTWSPGCRRLTPGPGYLEALTEPNVKTILRGISRVVPDGVIDDAGEFYPVDIIICATGFKIAFDPPFSIKGVGGVDMSEEFKPIPKVYLAMTVPKFPNYFVVNGVRGNWAVGSVLVSHDCQVEYITWCMKRIQTEGIKAFEVRPEPIEDLYEHIDEFHSRSIWSDDCSSWYKNGIKNGKVWIWGGSGLHYMRTIRMVRWEDYKYTYHNRNVWAFLGNGWTGAQVKKDRSNLAPYIRNSDTPWEFNE